MMFTPPRLTNRAPCIRNWWQGDIGLSRLKRKINIKRSGRNTFGTCFGETGLKILPDVFRHDDCEQKKHVLLCKMIPASHFFLFEKGEKNNNEICSQLLWRNTLGRLSVPLLVPGAFSRTRTVVDIRFAISCNRMRSHEIAWDRMRSRIIPFSGRIEFDSDLIRSHEIACDRM